MTDNGWECSTVEQRIPKCFITRDCFNFADIIAIKPFRKITLIQATGGGHLQERLDKIQAEPRALTWLICGGSILIHDWRQYAGERGRRLVELEVTKEHFGVSSSHDAGGSFFKLFDHMSKEHGLTLIGDELFQIVRVVDQMRWDQLNKKHE